MEEDPTLTQSQVEQIATSFRGNCDWADEVRLARRNALFDHAGDAPPNADRAVLAADARDYRTALSQNRVDDVADIVRDYAAKFGLSIAAESLEEKLIGRAILRELISSCETSIAAFAATVEGAPSAKVTAVEVSTGVLTDEPVLTDQETDQMACRDAHASATGESGLFNRLKRVEPRENNHNSALLELYHDYKKEQLAKASTDTWIQNEKIVVRFFEYLGPTASVQMITRRAIRDWKKALMSWPMKASQIKEFKLLHFSAIIEANRTIGRPTICEKSVNKYLAALGGFAEWLLTNEYIENDVMRGMYLAVDKNAKTVLPYNQEQLCTIINSPLFSECAGDGLEHKKGNVRIRDWRYWVPLIALYSGARLGEICQLSIQDVRQKGKYWIFHITREDTDGIDEEKTTKTEGSQRIVPIHNELIRLGFLGYLAEMRNAGELKLFPELKRDKRGFFGGASKFFNNYFRAIGVKCDAKHNFHSLRHSVADALRLADYVDEQFAPLLGHTKKSTTAIYGIIKPLTLRQRVKMINSIKYAGCNLDR